MPSESDKPPEISHLFLPDTLRDELSKPQGDLIRGSIDQTIPVLKQKLLPKKAVVVGVGDVTADILISEGFEPDIIITDGQTKREQLESWKEYSGYKIVEADCPPAEITKEAWMIIRSAIKELPTKIHIKIHGEEDLLVLPLIVELPLGSQIMYGQPNIGAVIREVSNESKRIARELLARFNVKT